MAVLDLRRMPDPVLRTQAGEVKKITRKTMNLIENMCETMFANEGVGLAAPQVGVLKRIIVFRNEEQAEMLINPRIIEREGAELGEEGCLSIPDKTGVVGRAQRIKVCAEDVDGREIQFVAENLLARILQHEIDHLDGVLFTDRAEEIQISKG